MRPFQQYKVCVDPTILSGVINDHSDMLSGLELNAQTLTTTEIQNYVEKHKSLCLTEWTALMLEEKPCSTEEVTQN